MKKKRKRRLKSQGLGANFRTRLRIRVKTLGTRPVSSATYGDVRKSSLNEFLTFIN